MDKLETLYSVLSSCCSGSVFFDEKPQDKDSCVVYHVISENPILGNLESTHIQLDLYSQTLDKLMIIKNNIEDELNGNKDDFTLSYKINGFVEKDIESQLYRGIIEFYIW